MTDPEALAAIALKAKLAIIASVGAIAIGAAVAYKVVTRPGESDKTPPAAPTRMTAEPAVTTEVKGDEPVTEKATALPETIRYGFRVDPMKFVEEGKGLEAALVRKQVFGRPKEGDEEIIQAEVDKILAEQKEDGSFADTSKQTGSGLLGLLRLGLPKDRPEVARAADAILRQHRADQNADEWYEKDGTLNVYPLHALCLLGERDVPEVAASLRWLAAHQGVWNDANQGCPWTPEVFWSALWAGRKVVPEVTEAVNDGLRRVTEGMNDAGCNSYNDPWGFTDAAGEIESGEAAALVAKQIPMILRGQRPDGGWGGKSLAVFRALTTHGLLKPLRKLPPLGPDWRIVREIPIPDGRWFSLTWDGENLWSCDHASGCAVALIPGDGHEVKRVAIANCGAVAWWDGALACVGGKPKELKKVDPETGEVLETISLASLEEVIGPEVVGGKVLVGDGFNCCVAIFDPAAPGKPRMQTLAGPGPACMAADGDAVWHADYWAPAIIKSDLDGKLLDWGEKPFDVRGLAFDGEHLWALDNKNKRIRMIEKTPTAPRVYRGAAGLRDDLYGLMNGLDKAQELEWGRVFLRDAEGQAEELAVLCGRYDCTQVVDRDGTILWLNGDERIEAAFSYVPDAGDLEALRDIYRRIERTDSPLTFVVLPQRGRKDTFDAHILSRRSSLEHSWELGIKAKAEAVPLAKGIRRDLYGMFRTPADTPTSPLDKEQQGYWSWRLSHSDEKAVAKLGRDAKHYGCTQSVESGYILWKGADGKPAVLFRIVRDQADPKVFRRLYDKMTAEGIPLAYCFVNAYCFGKQDQLGDWDVWSMSRQQAQVHCWRFWAHEARPEPEEERPDKDIF